MRTLRWLGLALTLLVAHVTLAVRAGSATGMGPMLTTVAIHAVAVAAVLVRWRRTPGEARQLWLLLALALGLQWLSGMLTVLAMLFGGELGHLMAVLAAQSSGSYMVPCMFMIARSFSRDMPRMVPVLDVLMSLCAAGLLYALIHSVVSLPPAQMREHVRELAYLADAVNFSLAVLATIRLFGAFTRLRRQAYFAAALFLWVNAFGVSGFNRLQQTGMPWWGGLLLDVALVVVIAVVLPTAPRWLQRLRPSRRTMTVIDGFTPVVLSISVLALGISVSRVNFAVGMVVSVLSLLFYGLRSAYIQSRDQHRQRLAALSNQRLQQQVDTDPMTGIANRSALDVHLRQVLQARERSGGTCSVLMVDVDFFKQYNDHFGHIAGDECLLRVVEVLSLNLMRAGDLIARYGGEEFAVVLPDSSENAAMVVAQRLVDAVADLRMAHPSSPEGHVTVSIGVASCSACGAGQSVNLLEAADQALYRAKRNGRNRCEAMGTEPEIAQLQASH